MVVRSSGAGDFGADLGRAQVCLSFGVALPSLAPRISPYTLRVGALGRCRAVDLDCLNFPR